MTNEQMRRDALERIADWLEDPKLTTWPYIEGRFYTDVIKLAKDARQALAATRDDVTLPRLDGKA